MLNSFGELANTAIINGVDSHREYCQTQRVKAITYKEPAHARTKFSEKLLTLVPNINGGKITDISNSFTAPSKQLIFNLSDPTAYSLLTDIQQAKAPVAPAASASSSQDGDELELFDIDEYIQAREVGKVIHYNQMTMQLEASPGSPPIKNPEVYKAVGYLLGAEKHVVALINYGEDWLLFNSLPNARTLFSKRHYRKKSAYLRLFKGPRAAAELARYLNDEVWHGKSTYQLTAHILHPKLFQRT